MTKAEKESRRQFQAFITGELSVGDRACRGMPGQLPFQNFTSLQVIEMVLLCVRMALITGECGLVRMSAAGETNLGEYVRMSAGIS